MTSIATTNTAASADVMQWSLYAHMRLNSFTFVVMLDCGLAYLLNNVLPIEVFDFLFIFNLPPNVLFCVIELYDNIFTGIVSYFRMMFQLVLSLLLSVQTLFLLLWSSWSNTKVILPLLMNVLKS